MGSTGRVGAASLVEVRAFVDKEVAPNADVFDQTEQLPESLRGQVAELGLWAPFLPVDVGGAGLDWVTVARIHEEVGRGCSGLRSLLTVHTMVSWSVHRWGDDAQRDRWLPQLVTGAVQGAFCLSEPDARAATRPRPARARSGPRTAGCSTDVKKWITGGQRRRPVPGVRSR